MELMEILYKCAMVAIGIVLIVGGITGLIKIINRLYNWDDVLLSVVYPVAYIGLVLIAIICLECYLYHIWFGGL